MRYVISWSDIGRKMLGLYNFMLWRYAFLKHKSRLKNYWCHPQRSGLVLAICFSFEMYIYTYRYKWWKISLGLYITGRMIIFVTVKRNYTKVLKYIPYLWSHSEVTEHKQMREKKAGTYSFLIRNVLLVSHTWLFVTFCVNSQPS